MTICCWYKIVLRRYNYKLLLIIIERDRKLFQDWVDSLFFHVLFCCYMLNYKLHFRQLYWGGWLLNIQLRKTGKVRLEIQAAGGNTHWFYWELSRGRPPAIPINFTFFYISIVLDYHSTVQVSETSLRNYSFNICKFALTSRQVFRKLSWKSFIVDYWWKSFT